MALSVVRPDSLPFEPVRIGPVLSSDELKFMITKRKGAQKFLDVISIVQNFDLLTYSYIFCCTYCVIAISAIITFCGRIRRKKRTVRKCKIVWLVMKSVSKYSWSICEIFLDQENLNPITWPDRILWLHYCLACFFTIFGIFLNLMSTEMVAVTKLPRIETLADLFLPYFSKSTPSVFTNLPSYSLIKSAPANSLLGALKERLNVNPRFSLINLDHRNSEYMMERARDVQAAISGDDTSLISSEWTIDAIRIGLCSSNPDLASKFYISKSFADGVMTFYFNKQFDVRAVNYISTKYSIVRESGLHGHIAKEYIKTVHLVKFGVPYGWTAMKCFEGSGENDNDSEEKLTSIGLQLISTQLTFKICGYCIAAAALVIIFELIFRIMCMMRMRRIITKCRKCIRLLRRRICRISLAIKIM